MRAIGKPSRSEIVGAVRLWTDRAHPRFTKVVAARNSLSVSDMNEQENVEELIEGTLDHVLYVNESSGYSVAVTAVEYLNGTTFTSACSTPTAPQEVFATATNTRTFASASINFVVDDRGGAAPLTSSVITIRSTAPTNPSLSSTYAPTATATSGDVVVVSIDSTSSPKSSMRTGRSDSGA